jgi:alpha-glucosidase
VSEALRIVDAEPVVATEWWRGAVIYQIYPRSFADANGDGIGDLPGITARLDHVASLGVDAIWISPFFTSPMKDFGYDVADYRAVDPIFGSLADFDVLITRAHALGLKVLIDQVYAHTSDQHAWFAESRTSRENPRAEWYVWADPKADGSPPNNWQSVFGGPAWTWDARRGQYFMHNFLSSQPQLNVHLPAVQDALIDVARFWLDRGVDGFRIDAINFAMFDPALADNPPAPPSNRPRSRPSDFQIAKNNMSHPDIPGFLERLRGMIDHYPDRFTVAEVGGDHAEREMKAFTRGDSRLNSAYGFNFLYAPDLTPALVRETIDQWPDTPDMGWPSWAFENHDAPRAVSRWCTPDDATAFARMKMLLLMCLRGNVFLYYGEELGLDQVEIGFDDLRDPEAIANWPMTLSRDGARTPMPWARDEVGAGFTTGKPWLPLGVANRARAVDVQQADPDSLLHLTRRLIAFRRDSAALCVGTMLVIEASEALLAFERSAAGERLLCVFNMGSAAIDFQPPPGSRWRIAESVGDATLARLGGFAAYVAYAF